MITTFDVLHDQLAKFGRFKEIKVDEQEQKAFEEDGGYEQVKLLLHDGNTTSLVTYIEHIEDGISAHLEFPITNSLGEKDIKKTAVELLTFTGQLSTHWSFGLGGDNQLFLRTTLPLDGLAYEEVVNLFNSEMALGVNASADLRKIVKDLGLASDLADNQDLKKLFDEAESETHSANRRMAMIDPDMFATASLGVNDVLANRRMAMMGDVSANRRMAMMEETLSNRRMAMMVNNPANRRMAMAGEEGLANRRMAMMDDALANRRMAMADEELPANRRMAMMDDALANRRMAMGGEEGLANRRMAMLDDTLANRRMAMSEDELLANRRMAMAGNSPANRRMAMTQPVIASRRMAMISSPANRRMAMLNDIPANRRMAMLNDIVSNRRMAMTDDNEE